MNIAYRIESTDTFERDLRKLDRAVARRILDKVKWLSERPELFSQPLRNMPDDMKGLQKYRVGDYRVLFWVYHDSRTMRLYAVAHRSVIYGELKDH